MRLLLDAQLDSAQGTPVAQTLNVMGARHDCEFESLTVIDADMKDPQIPGLCQEREVAALVTANFKDFGARLPLWHALLSAGVTVAVLRPTKGIKLTLENQGSLLLRALPRLAEYLRETDRPLLVKVTEGGVDVVHDLDTLAKQVSGTMRLPK